MAHDYKQGIINLYWGLDQSHICAQYIYGSFIYIFFILYMMTYTEQFKNTPFVMTK